MTLWRRWWARALWSGLSAAWSSVAFSADELTARCVDDVGTCVDVDAVWVLTADAWSDAMDHWCAEGGDLFARVRLEGRRLESGADGVWHGPMVTEPSWLIGESLHGTGRALVFPRQEVSELWVRDRIAFEVEVQTETGEPKPHATVELVATDSVGISEALLVRVTDARGVVSFEDVECLDAAGRLPTWGVRPAIVGVGVATPLLESARAVLTWPPTARLELVAAADIVTLELRFDGAEGVRRLVELEDGVATLDQMPVAVPWSLWNGAWLVAEDERVSEGGSRLDVRETLVRRPYIRGRLLSHSGEPLTHREYSIRPWSNVLFHSIGGSGWLRTDGEGRFSIDVLRAGWVEAGNEWLSIHEGLTTESAVLAMVDVRGVNLHQGIDLKDIHVGGGGTQITGTVTDRYGRPVPGVVLGMSDPGQFGTIATRPTDDLGKFASLVPAWSHNDVAFEVQGTSWGAMVREPPATPGEQLALTVDRCGTLSLPLPFIDVPRGVRRVLDVVVTPQQMNPWLRRAGHGVQSGDRWVVQGVPEGRYVVEIMLDARTLARFDQVVVRAGEECRDARLEAWNARDETRVVSLNVIPCDGATLSDLELFTEQPPEVVRTYGARGGLTSILSRERGRLAPVQQRPSWAGPRTGFDVVLPRDLEPTAWIDGTRVRRKRVTLRESCTIALDPEFEVGFILNDSEPPLALGPSCGLAIQLVPPGIGRKVGGALTGPIDGIQRFQQGRATLHLDRTDPVDVMWWIAGPVKPDGSYSLRRIETTERTTLPLVDTGAAPQFVGLRLPESLRPEAERLSAQLAEQ